MPVTCDFGGSYYNPSPWADRPCAMEAAVPEGCPIHYVTGAVMPFDGWSVTTQIEASDGTQTLTPNTLTILGADEESFSVMNTWSCDCEWTTLHVSFQHVAVDVPAARAGDSVSLWGAGLSGSYNVVEILPAAPCPQPEWPTDYSVGLACDRCPPQTNGEDQDPGAGPFDDVGCTASGGASPLVLVVLALVLLRRRSR